jgi:outer membrane protein OmpA-like peptidoglycan-associated protein
MKIRNVVLTTVLLAGASSIALAQSAQHPRGFYLGAGAGVSMLRDAGMSGSGFSNEIESNVGPAGVLSLGYGYGNGFRTEIELGGRHNSVDKVTGTGGRNPDGSVRALSGMLNVLYDIGTGTRFTPYIGGGLGAAHLNYNGTKTFNGTRTVDDNDVRFAYQGIVGFAVGLTDQLKATLDYRYFATLDPKLKTNDGRRAESEYASHTALLGLRYHFWTPPTAPAATPPAPTPTPAARPAEIQRSFLVFFDFNKSDITTEAARVIQQAADHAKRGGVSRIVVTGHTDTSGSAAYNQRLSERRAAAVRESLVRNGLAANQISTVGKGESEPLVKTGDGVKEPQNRRAEIVLQ